MTMNLILIASIFVPFLVKGQWDCPSNTSLCLAGDRHKTVASPEDSSYAACLDYQNSSCCTANFTQQLATSDVTHIVDGGTIFNWTHCGAISESCEAYLIEIECFYRCSPNMIYFAGDFPSSLNRVPVCSSFCDNWYDACKSDLTCVKNWIFEWDYDNKTGENLCPTNSSCMTFEEFYKNSTELCNVLWGFSFEYTDDDNGNDISECLTPGDYENNVDAVDNLFSSICAEDESNNNDDTGTVVIILIVVAVVVLVLIIVAVRVCHYYNVIFC